MEILLIKLLPLLILILAWKAPRIGLIVLALVLKWWIVAVLLLIITILKNVRINVMKMTKEEYEHYKETGKKPGNDT